MRCDMLGKRPHARSRRQRSAVDATAGWLAQSAERVVHTDEVTGSSPVPPTTNPRTTERATIALKGGAFACPGHDRGTSGSELRTGRENAGWRRACERQTRRAGPRSVWRRRKSAASLAKPDDGRDFRLLFGLDYRSQRCCDLGIDLLCCSRLFRSVTGETPSAVGGSGVACMESHTLQGADPFPHGDPIAWLREVVSRGVSAGANQYSIEYRAGRGSGEC